MVSLINYLLINDERNGIFNATSPNPVTNNIFTSTFAKALNRPALLTFPSALLKFLFGEMSHILLTGQRVIPKKISQAGFEFQYPSIDLALAQVCGRRK